MDEDWSVTEITKQLKDKAWSQLGTSGTGNHFVEFGVFDIDHAGLGVAPGSWFALLTHSGSRGTGATVAEHYSRLAADEHPELEGASKQLAWLTLDSESGQEYWRAMELMGQYAYRPLREWRLGRILEQLLSMTAKHRVRIPAELFLMVKTLTELRMPRR